MFLAMLHSLWDLSSPTRDQTSAPAVKVPSLNLWMHSGELCAHLFEVPGLKSPTVPSRDGWWGLLRSPKTPRPAMGASLSLGCKSVV